MASNLQVLCMRCNNTKHAEWCREYGWQGYPISRGVLLQSYLLTPRDCRADGGLSCGI